jgi:hypothetical protein
MLGYLSEVARCKKMPSKSTFWAAKPVKKRQKEKVEGADAVNGGVGTPFFPLEGAGCVPRAMVTCVPRAMVPTKL